MSRPVEYLGVVVGPRGLAGSHSIENYGQENCATSGLRSHGRRSEPPEIHPRTLKGPRDSRYGMEMSDAAEAY